MRVIRGAQGAGATTLRWLRGSARPAVRWLGLAAFAGLAFLFGGIPGLAVGVIVAIAWARGARVTAFWAAGVGLLAAGAVAVVASGVPGVSPSFGRETIAGHVLVGAGLASLLFAAIMEIPATAREGRPVRDRRGAEPLLVTEPDVPAPSGRGRRAVVIGLDGATWKVLEPLLEAGAMPALAALLDRSASGVLRSTFPPYTPPAWTTALTGVNPGRHGIFGFVHGSGRDAQLVHWGLVREPALWDLLDGGTVGLFHVPLTFPPPRVPGWCVGAVWMPTGRPIRGYTHPASLEARIESMSPRYAPVIGVDVRQDWRGTDLALRAARTMQRRHRVLGDLLERHPADVIFAVIEVPDRLQHAYYRYLDPAEPMSRERRATLVRRAAEEAFGAVDRLVGLLDAYAGEDGVAMVVSDHGATAWDGYLHGNTLLEREGLLRLTASGRALRSSRLARAAPLVAGLVPQRMGKRLRRWSGSLIDVDASRAFASRLGSQGFSVNAAAVRPKQRDEVLRRVRSTVRRLRTPAGEPFAEAVHARDEVYRGAATEHAPDLLVEPRGWRWEISDRVGAADLFEEFHGVPLGCHHPDGVFALRAPGVRAGRGPEGRIEDVLPTLLYAAGHPVPRGLDGSVLQDLFEPSAPPVVTVAAPHRAGPQTPDGDSAYTPAEEEQIVKYLTDLGYLG